MAIAWRTSLGGPCSWCGEPIPIERGRSNYCRDSCKLLRSQNKGKQSTRAARNCVRCAAAIDMTRVGPSGRRRREDVLMCDPCRRAKYTRHKYSVTLLVKRDGTDCGICGEAVDMTLRMPDLMSASVDHIVPFARGGSHEPSNLQLAHNICNRRKSARTLAAGQTVLEVS